MKIKLLFMIELSKMPKWFTNNKYENYKEQILLKKSIYKKTIKKGFFNKLFIVLLLIFSR